MKAKRLHGQSVYLVEALKAALKDRGMTYADVADAIGLSHASTKRIFARRSFTLDRIEMLCELIGIDFLDLARMAEEARPRAPDTLNDQQEQALIDDQMLLFCFHLLLGGWTVARIESFYGIEQAKLIPALVKLERLGLIHLLPGNAVRLLTARNIKWRPGGPLRRFFELRVKEEFLESDFSLPDSVWEFEMGEVSEASRDILARRIAALFREARDLVAQDAALPATLKTNIGLLAASTSFPLEVFARDIRETPVESAPE